MLQKFYWTCKNCVINVGKNVKSPIPGFSTKIDPDNVTRFHLTRYFRFPKFSVIRQIPVVEISFYAAEVLLDLSEQFCKRLFASGSVLFTFASMEKSRAD